MQKNSKKNLIPVIMAGIFILFYSFLSGANLSVITFAAEKTYNKNIVVEGVEIGGFSKAKADFYIREKIINDLKTQCLKISSGKDVYYFYYPEVNFESNLNSLLNTLKNEKPSIRQEYQTDIKYYLNNIDNVIENIYYNNYKKSENAEIIFLPEEKYPFKFLAEKNGKEIDKELLKTEIENSINNGFYEINAQNLTIFPHIKQEQLKKLTNLRSKFSTYYGYSMAERKSNIALAARFISGKILEPNEEFSFNQTVGERSLSRGFKQAKIIFDGKFIDGVGGGVCQLSTTLYNAALLSNLNITEQHPHTLSVSYVEASFDAMVNSYTSDLKFINNTGGKIFIKITADGQRLTVYIYGEKNEYEIKRISVIKAEIQPPESEIIIGDTEEIVQKAKIGIESDGYLRIYKNGVFIETKHIRKDRYKPVQEIRKIIQN